LYGQGTENFSDDCIRGPWWLGLPSKPTWLTWFGAPYRELVSPSLNGLAVPGDQGLFVRLGQEPMDTDQLKGRTPGLPSELLVNIEAKPGDGPMRSITHYERIPAKHIPPLS
jgi:hypothetical protein